MKVQILQILTEVQQGTKTPIKAQKELLDLFGVSQQREQLISFFNWYKDDPKELSNNETIVDAYLEEINCC